MFSASCASASALRMELEKTMHWLKAVVLSREKTAAAFLLCVRCLEGLRATLTANWATPSSTWLSTPRRTGCGLRMYFSMRAASSGGYVAERAITCLVVGSRLKILKRN